MCSCDCATNRGLQQEVDNGRFREDLFYRLNVFTINLPSLNEQERRYSRTRISLSFLFAHKTNSRLTGMSKKAFSTNS